MTENQSVKEALRASYGENKPIDGEYDAALAAKCKNGTFVGKEREGVAIYRGIPFAKPPVGALRWKRPEPADPCDAVLEAYYNGKSQLQTEWHSEQASYYPQGEDCLYLNLWANKACTDEKKPVMVFFHGGAYGWGGTADPLYDGYNFAKANPDIILVTVAYRIGLMGFIDLSYLEGGEAYPDAPNLGILDQIESLRWVHENIAAFGGDPDNVTIFGESAGGGSVSLLPIIPEAHGLFKRVIAESGSVALTYSKEECKTFTDKVVKFSGATTMDELLALSEEELIRLNEEVNSYNNFPQRDGKLIPLNPYDGYRQGLTKDIDVMFGTNAHEMNYWVGELGGIVPFRFGMPVRFESDLKLFSKEDKARIGKFMSMRKGHRLWKITEFYNELLFRLPAIRQAELHTMNGAKAYMYYWTEQSTLRFRGACHAVELAYVFGNTQETIYTGEPADEELAKKVMQMWTNFARCGDPSIEGFDWQPYDGTERRTAIISKELKMHADVLSKQRIILMPLVRYMVNASYVSIDMNVPFTRKVIGVVAGVTAVTAGLLISKLLKK